MPMKKLFLGIFISFFNPLLSQKINEVCPSNTTIYDDENEHFSDWIEFINSTDTTVNLVNWSLTNEKEDLKKWTFPTTYLESGEKVVFPANNESNYTKTIDFSLNKEGEKLYLVNPDGLIKDSVYQPGLNKNHSYGRIGEKWYYFNVPTPEEDNEEAIGYKGYATKPIIYERAGLHPKGKQIAIRSTKNEEVIFYSLNGKNPKEELIYYTPITLDRSMSISAVATADSLIDSDQLNRTFFVPIDHKLPVVNLTVDSSVLFDKNEGVYQLGPEADSVFPYYGANFWKDIEIPIYYEYFDQGMNLLEALECDLKIHGGPGSRIRAMKSLQIRAKNSYDKTAFEIPYFADKEIDRFKRLVLRNAGNDFCNSCIKDGVLHKFFLKNDFNVDLLGYQPVVVYINGSYLGIHNLREKVDRHYLVSNYDVNPDEINLLEGKSLKVIEGSSVEFKTLKNYARVNDLSEKTHFDWVEERIDLNSFIDYFIIELYANNRDWPNNNLKVWNAPSHEKWRYICYDLDISFRYSGNEPEDIESLTFLLDNLNEINPHVTILNALLENEQFRMDFVNRYADLLNTSFKKEEIFEFLLHEKGKLAPDMKRHYEKWCGPIKQWDERFYGLEGFINSRQEIIRTELSSLFSFSNASEMRFDIYPFGAGELSVNTLDSIQVPFYGAYFSENPIEIKVTPDFGETFKYWENVRTREKFFSENITVFPKQGDYYIAIFDALEHPLNLKAFPNPFQRNLNIEFSLPQSSDINVEIYKPDGTLIKALIQNEFYEKGTQRLETELAELSNGIYFLSVRTAYQTEAIRIMKQ